MALTTIVASSTLLDVSLERDQLVDPIQTCPSTRQPVPRTMGRSGHSSSASDSNARRRRLTPTAGRWGCR